MSSRSRHRGQAAGADMLDEQPESTRRTSSRRQHEGDMMCMSSKGPAVEAAKTDTL